MSINNNTSIFITSIVGPDGVGKTTSINECKKILESKEFCFISKHHVWGNLDERPSNFDTRRTTLFQTIPNKNRKNIILKAYNYFVTILNQIYAEIRYVVKLRRMILESARKYDLVLIDRYLFDKISAKESRKSYDFQYSLRKVLTRFIFKPDLCILLSNTPKVIHQRKKELSEKEAELYLSSIKRIAKKNSSNFREISTDKSPEDIGKEMVDVIESFNIGDKFLKKNSAEVLDLNTFFLSLKDISFLVLKTETSYSVPEFPNKYPNGKDLDIFVKMSDFQKVKTKAKKFAKKYKNIFSIVYIKDSKSKFRIRFLEGNKLHYQIDIESSLKYTDSIFSDNLLSTRIKKDTYYVPRKDFEVWIRIIEYRLNESKSHHFKYIIDNKSYLNYDLIRDNELKSYTKKLFDEVIKIN